MNDITQRTVTTDDLALAAMLATIGARVKDVEYIAAKRRSDITLDVSTFKLSSGAVMARQLADTLDEMGDDFSMTELEVAFKGTLVHHYFTWLTDLRRMVMARRK